MARAERWTIQHKTSSLCVQSSPPAEKSFGYISARLPHQNPQSASTASVQGLDVWTCGAGRSDTLRGVAYPKPPPRHGGPSTGARKILDVRTHGAPYPLQSSSPEGGAVGEPWGPTYRGWTIGEGEGGPHVTSSTQSGGTPFFLGHFLTQETAI